MATNATSRTACRATDVYFWSDRHQDALELISTVRQNSSSAHEVEDKIRRAENEAVKNGVALLNKKALLTVSN